MFDGLLQTEVSHRLRLEGDLRLALATGQLSVAYQPIFDLRTRQLIGFEALARWNHPELGHISPLSFVAVAEEAGLAVPLTDFVLRTACAQLREWQLKDPAFSDLHMHVNVSGNDIAHAKLVARVLATLDETNLLPCHLTLELTENVLMQKLEAALPTLTELRRHGVGLSVDDFGTGHLSLRHLSSLPVNSLKIDRGFVHELQRGPSEAAVLRAIVLLGTSLGKSIIGAGIENAEQMDQLRRMGCHAGQGFHFARALPADRVHRLLDRLLAKSEVAPEPDVRVGEVLH